MNGGPQGDALYEKIVGNRHLYELVMNTNLIIGESAGSTVCGEYRRTHRDNKAVTTKGLGILKSTIIEAHFSKRKRHVMLRDEMQQAGAEYGLGIDSLAAAVIDTKTFPKKYQVIGSGRVELVKDDK